MYWYQYIQEGKCLLFKDMGFLNRAITMMLIDDDAFL